MVRVAVLGAAGGIGQPLSLLLKLNHEVTELHLYDVVNAPGVGADLSHIPTNCTVKCYPSKPGHTIQEVNEGPFLKEAVTGVDLAVIPAGVPRKPGMTRDDLFKINAGIVAGLVSAIAEKSPKAAILIISNPVNSTVPIAAEILKKKGVYNPKKLFGVTLLDYQRASRFLRDIDSDVDATEVKVPVIGGHSGETIIPLFSQSKLSNKLTKEQIQQLTHRVQFGGDEVVKAKDGMGSATLSMAYAGATFANKIIDALQGQETIVPAYIDLDADPTGAKFYRELGANDLSYFACLVKLGKFGVEKISPVGKLSDFEATKLQAAYEVIQKNIAKGYDFGKNFA